MGTTVRRAAGALLLILLAQTGCGTETSDPLALEFADRAEFQSCGEVTKSIEEGPEMPASALACLRAPLDGAAENAEFGLGVTTVEGDVIRSWYRTQRGRPLVEVYVDRSADQFGDRSWLRCEIEFSAAAESRSCSVDE